MHVRINHVPGSICNKLTIITVHIIETFHHKHLAIKVIFDVKQYQYDNNDKYCNNYCAALFKH